jgi:hypothetical protein
MCAGVLDDQNVLLITETVAGTTDFKFMPISLIGTNSLFKVKY